MPTSESFAEPRSGGPRTFTALLLEGIALRHQIVLERSGTCRPCFRRWDRLFWILLSCWWRQWSDSLIIVQPETVLRWRREGWSALWRYRSRGRWRGGRPKVSREVRPLIGRMARENFPWGAPRIHGELLMLGFSVSEATVSRYLRARGRRPGQSWRTFVRNQARAFAHREYAEERSRGDAGLHMESYRTHLRRSWAGQIARLWVRPRRRLAQPKPTLTFRRIGLRSAQRAPGVTHRVASVAGASRRELYSCSRAAFPIRSPPQHAGSALAVAAGDSTRRNLVRRCPRIRHAGPYPSGRLELISFRNGPASVLPPVAVCAD
jgi:hypothetical protein